MNAGGDPIANDEVACGRPGGRRWLFPFAAVSLVLLVLSIVTWGFSFAYPYVRESGDSDKTRLGVERGVFSWTTSLRRRLTQHEVTTIALKRRIVMSMSQRELLPMASLRQLLAIVGREDVELTSLDIFHNDGVNVYGSGEARTVKKYRIPLWLPAPILSLLPAVWTTFWIRKRQRERRMHAGLCPVCGYDLRESAAVCPECGLPRPRQHSSVENPRASS